MMGSQEAISIPVVYIETFVMTLVAFLIGYVGASLYGKLQSKKHRIAHTNEINRLNNNIKRLQNKLDTQADSTFKKDRMDEEFDHLQVRSKAFSNEVISEKLIPSKAIDKEKSKLINFERIGISKKEDSHELQQITGIGPYTEAKLNELGIFTFDQISRFTKEDIEVVTKLIKFFPDRIKNDQWVSKAKRLMGPDLNDSDTQKKMMIHNKTT